MKLKNKNQYPSKQQAQLPPIHKLATDSVVWMENAILHS
jgi:hypothetical protein